MQTSPTEQTQATYQRGTYREITPNAGPRVTAGADVFLTANFIWWKVVQEGTSYAISGVNLGAAPASDPYIAVSKGKKKSIGEDWAPGFKVGIGLNLNHDGWDLYAQYTWLHAKKHSSSLSLKAPAGTEAINGILPLDRLPELAVEGGGIIGYGNRAFAKSASASWAHHLNVIDLELGRNFYLSQYLTMRPYIGFKGT
jgi:hypothetical protein